MNALLRHNEAEYKVKVEELNKQLAENAKQNELKMEELQACYI
jgi:hypothetical protein